MSPDLSSTQKEWVEKNSGQSFEIKTSTESTSNQVKPNNLDRDSGGVSSQKRVNNTCDQINLASFGLKEKTSCDLITRSSPPKVSSILLVVLLLAHLLVVLLLLLLGLPSTTLPSSTSHTSISSSWHPDVANDSPVPQPQFLYDQNSGEFFLLSLQCQLIY